MMRHHGRLLLSALILLCFVSIAHGIDNDYRKQNVGLILDTPFLHQTDYPFASRFYGAYGNEDISYEYDGRGMPVFVRYADPETALPFVDMEARYRRDGHLESIVFLSYDEDGTTVVFRDEFIFESFTDAGPRFGYLTTSDGGVAEMRLVYDEIGRLVLLEEDDAYGDGLFRVERFAWADADRWPVLPYAVEIYYGIDEEVERYFYLYDAYDRLIGLEGENTPLFATEDRVIVGETYYYRNETLDTIFGPVDESGPSGQTAGLYQARLY